MLKGLISHITKKYQTRTILKDIKAMGIHANRCQLDTNHK